ncbi:MAG: hypothetical protein OXH15_15820 [Gammaproteobacteria bacterium]|nr:hypothetical protein [Gammaproteobacteria bacterium]
MANQVKIADEVWLAAAILHRRHPDRADFAIDEIMAEAESADVTGMPLRPGVKDHVYQHCVANKAPSAGRYRMLYETSSGRRRLFRPGDTCHPGRANGKDVPARDAVPMEYRDLIDWYHVEFSGESGRADDPVLALRGLGNEVWENEGADEYVRRQRAD